MSYAPHKGMRVGGAWFALASLLLGGSLAFHGPIPPGLSERMSMIATNAAQWVVVHWVAAVALSLFVVAGLVVLASRSRLTENGWTLSAWAVLSVGALWTVATAVAEATAITDAAASGNTTMFAAWWAFAEMKATGFAVLALAVAVIAASEARSVHPTTPAWASWTAAVAGVVTFIGWALGIWLGIGFGNLLWLVSSLVMCLWGVWFGMALARTNETG